MAKRGGSGGGRSAGGGDQSTDPAPQVLPSEQATENSALPTGVERRQVTENLESFTATVAGIPIEVEFTKQRKETSISFAVGNRYDRNDNLTFEQSTQVVPKIREIINYRVSQSAEGDKFSAIAWTNDGRGLERALAYARSGLSAPTRIGGKQSGTVRNGKLVPTISPEQQRSRIRSLLEIGRRRRSREN